MESQVRISIKRQRNKGKTIKKRKRFCSGNSRTRKRWSDNCMKLFSLLCRQVEERQQQTVELEPCIRQTFKKEFNQTRRKGTVEASNDQTSVTQDTL